MEKLALIAGNGNLPYNFLVESKRKGFDVYPIALFDTCDKRLLKDEKCVRLNVGEIKKLIMHLNSNGIKKLIMLGKVEKSIIFTDIQIDELLAAIIARLPDRKDETLLFGIIMYLKSTGIEILPQNFIMSEIMAEEKTYTTLKLKNEDDIKSVEIGIEAAKTLGKLDVGQTVVVKNKSVVALEAIEGTDETIKRAGIYAGSDTIIVKTARPQQDMRVDVPTIGLKTVETAVNAGVKGIIVEAGKVIFIEKEEAVALADKNNIFITGMKI